MLFAAAINTGGTIVGGTCAEDDALVWMSDHQYDLNTIDGTTGVTLTNAQGVNDRGQIVAIGHLTNGDHHVFLLTPNRHPAQASVAAAPRTGSNTLGRQGSPRRRTLRSGRALRTRCWRLSREARPRAATRTEGCRLGPGTDRPAQGRPQCRDRSASLSLASPWPRLFDHRR